MSNPSFQQQRGLCRCPLTPFVFFFLPWSALEPWLELRALGAQTRGDYGR